MKTRMIPTLKRVVSISLLLGLAAGSAIVARRLGRRPDPRMVRFLNSPGVIESFARRASANKADGTVGAKSPLVVQAEAFALYLNPPEPPRRTPPPPRPRVAKVEVAPVATAVSPKFRVVGISYHRSRPAESRALVSQAGSGLSWVAQGAKLGRMVVRRINRGSIVYQGDKGLRCIFSLNTYKCGREGGFISSISGFFVSIANIYSASPDFGAPLDYVRAGSSHNLAHSTALRTGFGWGVLEKFFRQDLLDLQR